MDYSSCYGLDVTDRKDVELTLEFRRPTGTAGRQPDGLDAVVILARVSPSTVSLGREVAAFLPVSSWALRRGRALRISWRHLRHPAPVLGTGRCSSREVWVVRRRRSRQLERAIGRERLRRVSSGTRSRRVPLTPARLLVSALLEARVPVARSAAIAPLIE